MFTKLLRANLGSCNHNESVQAAGTRVRSHKSDQEGCNLGNHQVEVDMWNCSCNVEVGVEVDSGAGPPHSLEKWEFY